MQPITLTHIAKRYGDKVIFENASFQFAPGEWTCLMGPSGCGKTTLLHLIMGLTKPDAGCISGIPREIAAVFQEDRLCEMFSVESNLRLVCGSHLSSAEAEACLTALGLPDCLSRPVRELSGGMKRRVALARALLAPASLLLLDEPLKGLDADTKQLAVTALKQYSLNKTVLCVTHDEEEAKALAASVITLPPRL